MRTACGMGGCLFAILVALLRRETMRPPRGQWGRLFVFSMLNHGLFIVLSTKAQVYLPASEAVVITYTLPIWASLFAWPARGGRIGFDPRAWGNTGSAPDRGTGPDPERGGAGGARKGLMADGCSQTPRNHMSVRMTRCRRQRVKCRVSVPC